MPRYVSISDVKKNPAILSRATASGLTVVMKNNKPSFMSIPYVEGLDDVLEDAMMTLNPKFRSSLDAAEAQVRAGNVVTLSTLKARLKK